MDKNVNSPNEQDKQEAMTGKQELFCYEYLIDFNATKAAIRAGYSEKSAYSQGHDLLKKPEIKKLIKTFSFENINSALICRDRIISELVQIGFDTNSKPSERIKALSVLLDKIQDSQSAEPNISTSQVNRAMEILKKFKNNLSN